MTKDFSAASSPARGSRLCWALVRTAHFLPRILSLTIKLANATMTGLVTAIYDIGCALGAVGAFVFGEQLGRKRSIILAQIIGTMGV
jgi:MFS family permease